MTFIALYRVCMAFRVLAGMYDRIHDDMREAVAVNDSLRE